MPRPRLPVGTWGEINVTSETKTAKEGKTRTTFRAFAYYRDYDGITRQVERAGKSRTDASNRLKEALRDRAKRFNDSEITGDSLVSDLGKLWLRRIAERVAAEKLAPTTGQSYGDQYNRTVLPAVGNLKIRECTVARIDAVIRTIIEKNGPGAAKLSRTVLSGMLGMAARYDALDSNPVRDIERIETRRKKPRALMTDEVLRLRARTVTDAKAVSRDLPDFVDAMLVTGVRVGEVCAITWDALDLDNRLVEIRGTVIRLKGVGLVLQLRPKSEAGYRTLRLPHWFVSVLRARKERITEPNEWNVVFTSPLGHLRDPSNTSADIRDLVTGSEFAGWLTSHTFRKTAATLMDDEGITARLIADQLGHARPSMTQDVYMARRQISEAGAVIFERFGTAG